MAGRTVPFGEYARREALEKGEDIVYFYLGALKVGIKKRGYDNYLLQASTEYEKLTSELIPEEIGDFDGGLAELASDMGVKNHRDMIDTLKGDIRIERTARDTKTFKKLIEAEAEKDARIEAANVEGEKFTKSSEQSKRLKAITGKVTDERVDGDLDDHFLSDHN
jgi:hypothetical protein